MKRNMITSYHPAITIQTYRLRLGILYNRTFPNFCRMPVFECCLSCICWCDGSFRWLNTWDEWVKCFLLLWLMSPTRRRQTVLICLPIWFIVSQQLHWICASPRRGKKNTTKARSGQYFRVLTIEISVSFSESWLVTRNLGTGYFF